MKYLLIFFLSFTLVMPVYAAREIQGTIPDLAPLQPPPEGVFLDYENSLNSPPSEKNDSETEGNGSQTGATDSGNFQEPGENTSPHNGVGVKNIFFVIFVIIIVGGGLYYVKRKRP